MQYLVALQGWLPLILLLSYLYPAVNIVKNVVHEKERRLKVGYEEVNVSRKDRGLTSVFCIYIAV